jgi:D-ornithine 4,5-aminomutase subunit alpha
MSDDELHGHFWSLVEKITSPLIEEARTHTSPSIERSVLLRMGFSSVEAKTLVDAFAKRDLLGHGTGRLILELAKAKDIPVRDAGEALLQNRCWEELEP